MCMGRREGGEKSYLKSQLGNHSSILRAAVRSIFNFIFPAFCVAFLHAAGDGGSVSNCLKQIVSRYFFQMNCFLYQFNIL